MCLRLLTRREHSRRELLSKLLQRGYEENEIEMVVSQLAAQGWQSEQRFTEQFVLNRAEKGFGPRRVAFELRERGIDEHLAEDWLSALEIDWVVMAKQAYRRKFRENHPPRDEQELQRRRSFLYQQRGFTPEQIAGVFDFNS